jgi:predicted nucleic acid-binding protein
LTRISGEAAWEMFQAYEDKEWSFTDCTSFVLMQRRQLYLAFSFDYHFKQAGFQLWPTLS